MFANQCVAPADEGVGGACGLIGSGANCVCAWGAKTLSQ
jgi:hypothetical protein